MPKYTNTDIEGDVVTLKSVDFPRFQPLLSGTSAFVSIILYTIVAFFLSQYWSRTNWINHESRFRSIMKADLDLKQLFSRLSLSDGILLSFSKMLSNEMY